MDLVNKICKGIVWIGWIRSLKDCMNWDNRICKGIVWIGLTGSVKELYGLGE